VAKFHDFALQFSAIPYTDNVHVLLNPCVTHETALATSGARQSRGAQRGRRSVATRGARRPSAQERFPEAASLNLPFGPCTSTESGAIWIFTPAGTAIGFLPMRDIARWLSATRVFETSTRPRKELHAHVRLPRRATGHHALGVVMILMPIPPTTGRISDEPLYLRLPGLEMRFRSVMTLRCPECTSEKPQCFADLVFLDQLIGRNVSLLPSEFGHSTFNFEVGISTPRVPRFGCVANRVSKSEMGSVCMSFSFPTAGLHYAGISPRSACPRKQMRHIENLRK